MSEKSVGRTRTDRSVFSAKSDLEERDQTFGGGSSESSGIAGLLLVLAALGTVACSVLGRFALGLSEDSAAQSFSAYRQHELPIFLTYGGGMIAGLMFIVAAPLVYISIASSGSARLRVVAICQALAGLTLALSASRWLIVLPFLQKQYDNGQSSGATRAAIDVDYQTISYFMGITLGEHLFAILTGLWTVILASHLLRLRGERRWLGWLGLIAGLGWLLGSVEQLDFNAAQYFIVFLAGGPVTWLIWTIFVTREIRRRARDLFSSPVD